MSFTFNFSDVADCVVVFLLAFGFGSMFGWSVFGVLCYINKYARKIDVNKL